MISARARSRINGNQGKPYSIAPRNKEKSNKCDSKTKIADIDGKRDGNILHPGFRGAGDKKRGQEVGPNRTKKEEKEKASIERTVLEWIDPWKGYEEIWQ